MGTRGFDRGSHCGTAGRGRRQSPKNRRQTNNWQARASPSRLSAATFIGSRSSTGPNERRLSRCCPTDADRKDKRLIGWPRRRTMPVRTVGGEKQTPAMPVEVLVQGLFWTGSSTLPRLHQARLRLPPPSKLHFLRRGVCTPMNAHWTQCARSSPSGNDVMAVGDTQSGARMTLGGFAASGQPTRRYMNGRGFRSCWRRCAAARRRSRESPTITG